ncbi:MAG TPA: 2-phospho-L-lactate transferase [Mycobacteriales bacterium]|nr:2-phospho-L-lactate transferase [Mycobacteriales bacterium]
MIVVLAGGVGAARFLRGLLAATDEPVTVVGNTGDDITLHGLRVCPDLDTVTYTLGGGIDEERGWGRAGESYAVAKELEAYGAPTWFTLGDRDLATHLYRRALLDDGVPLSEVTRRVAERWRLPVTLLPMTDDPVETRVVAGGREMHFQEYWVGLRASLPVERVWLAGDATPAPGVLDAIAAATTIVLPPSNPVVSIGTILAVPGIREAVERSAAPKVGVSPIIGGAPVHGMADRMLAAIGVDCTAAAVALHYGDALLDGWLVDDSDADAVPSVEAAGIRCRAVPLWMSDVEATAAIARAALALTA